MGPAQNGKNREGRTGWGIDATPAGWWVG